MYYYDNKHYTHLPLFQNDILSVYGQAPAFGRAGLFMAEGNPPPLLVV